MSLIQNTFEGGTDATTITTVNSGGLSGTAFNVANGSGSVRAYTTANVVHGSLAARITAAANESQLFGYDNLFSANSLAIRFYITFLADTSANGAVVCQVRNDSTYIGDVSMFTGLSLRAGNGAGYLSNSIYAVSLNTVYRVEVYMENGTTTGRYKYAIYAGESTTALASADLTNTDMGSAAFTRVRFGKTGVQGSVDYVIDSIAVQDGAADFIGPYTGGGGGGGGGSAPIYKQNTFEGGTNGASITAGSSGGASGDVFTVVSSSGTATRTFTNANPIKGGLSARITSASTADSVILGYDGFSSTAFAYRFYVTFLADTTADGASLYQLRNSTTRVGSVAMNTGRSLRATYTSSGITLPGTIYTVSLNTVYRVEGFVEPGATSTSGHYKYALYAGDSTTPLLSVDLSNLDLGSSAITDTRFGKTGAVGTVDALFDDFAISTTATDFIGPSDTSNLTPTANAGSDQTVDAWDTVTLAGTDSDSDGTIVARTWRQISGSPSVTLNGSGANRTYQAPGTLAGTTLVFGYKVTDNDGQDSTEDTVTHTINAANERAVIGGAEEPMRIDEV